MRIYVDNAATTKMNAAVAEEMIPFMTEFYGNPSSIYLEGREAKRAVESRENKLQRLFQRNPKKYISREAVQKQIIGLDSQCRVSLF